MPQHLKASFRLSFALVVVLLSMYSSKAQTTIYEPDVLVRTVAGSGFSGYLDGEGLQTFFNYPWAIILDRATNVLVWDSGNNRVRKVDPGGRVTTLAGNGGPGLEDGPGTNATFIHITSFVVEGEDSILAADNARIRRITSAGFVTTFAGFERGGYVDGPSNTARFGGHLFLAIVDQDVFVSDTANKRIRKIAVDGTVSTFAGSGNDAVVDGVGIFSAFHHPQTLTVDHAGNLLVLDGHNYIRRISRSGAVETLVGPGVGQYSDGTGLDVGFGTMVTLTADERGDLVVLDTGRIRRISKDTRVRILAGTTVGFRDGAGTNAMFGDPMGLAVSPAGDLFVADRLNHRIRQVRLGRDTGQPVGVGIATYPGISINGTPGGRYRIEFAEVPDGPWRAITTVTVDSLPYVWFDREPQRIQKRFYRAVQLP